jgi:hypothetical protein
MAQKFWRSILAGAAALLVPLAAAAEGADVVPKDPIALYGPQMKFEIWRKGSRIGQHVVDFAREGEELVVTSRMNIAIRVVFISAYHFDYQAVERWSGGSLASLDARVDDNGTKRTITARRTQDGLRVSGGKQGEVTAPATAIPTNHWNADQPLAPVKIDTLDGVLREGPAQRLGEARINLPGGPVDTLHYAYTGALAGTEVWYAGERWVQMRFKGRDGSTIEYRCVHCGV